MDKDNSNNNKQENKPEQEEVLFLPKYENKPEPNLIIKEEFKKEDVNKFRYIIYPAITLLALLSYFGGSYFYTSKASAYQEKVSESMTEMRDNLFDSISCNLNSANYRDDLLLRAMDRTKPLLDKTYLADDLVKIPSAYSRGGKEVFVREAVLDDLVEMLNDARSVGIFLEVNSGFRSFQIQSEWFESSRQNGVVGLTALPGSSEHQLGVAVDISAFGSDAITNSGYVWLLGNAYKYGFNLTYPQGRESETGLGYEPWHWRYVGKKVAKEQFDSSNLFNLSENIFVEGDDGVYPSNFFGNYLGLYIYKNEDSNKIILDNKIGNIYPVDAIYKDFREVLKAPENKDKVKTVLEIRGVQINLYAKYVEKINSHVIFVYEDVRGVSYSDDQIESTLKDFCPAL